MINCSILVLASKVLGYLARAGGATTTDEVEWEVCSSILSLIVWLSIWIYEYLMYSGMA